MFKGKKRLEPALEKSKRRRGRGCLQAGLLIFGVLVIFGAISNWINPPEQAQPLPDEVADAGRSSEIDISVGSDAPTPGATETPAPKDTPIATATEVKDATDTAAPAATASQTPAAMAAQVAQALTPSATYHYSVHREGGWPELTFVLKRVDLWPVLPDGKQPRNGLFVVLLGDLISKGHASCLYKRNYELNIGGQIFKTPETNAVNSLREIYEGVDYPMSGLGACVSKDETKQIFLWFDVADAEGPISLKLDGADTIAIADTFELVITESEWSGFPTATPTPINTSTSTPTQTKTSTATPLPTNTATSTALPTATLLPTNTAIATALPDAVLVITTVAPAAVESGAVAGGNANLRSGPGTDFAIVGGVVAGEALDLVGRNADGTWYQLANGHWIAAFLVEGVAASIPVAPVPELPSQAAETALVDGAGTGSGGENNAPPAAAPTNTPAQAPVVSGGVLEIVAVNKRDEFVDIRNVSSAAVELGGWMLRSEKGMQDCALSGVIEAGATLRIWAMAEDAGQDGFNCGFDDNIWNNSDSDPAVLFGPGGVEVDRG